VGVLDTAAEYLEDLAEALRELGVRADLVWAPRGKAIAFPKLVVEEGAGEVYCEGGPMGNDAFHFAWTARGESAGRWLGKYCDARADARKIASFLGRAG
jgi:hypothetical protein